jgi:hypothetical protein
MLQMVEVVHYPHNHQFSLTHPFQLLQVRHFLGVATHSLAGTMEQLRINQTLHMP